MTCSRLQLTIEFKFSIAAFYHAYEAYRVPELLKRMYGAPLAVALLPPTHTTSEKPIAGPSSRLAFLRIIISNL